MTYLHAGMIQHDPSGNPTFLHRTAEGKVYPFNHGYRKVSSTKNVLLSALFHHEGVKMLRTSRQDIRIMVAWMRVLTSTHASTREARWHTIQAGLTSSFRNQVALYCEPSAGCLNDHAPPRMRIMWRIM